MALRHEDVAVASDGHVVGLKEEPRIDVAASLAEGHQELSIWTEFEHLMTFSRAGRSSKRASPSTAALRRGRRPRCRAWSGCASRRCTTRRAGSVVLIVSDPHVAIAVDMNAMRRDDQAGSKALHKTTACIKEKDRIDTCRIEPPAVSAVTFGYPDGLAVLGNVDSTGRAPHPAGRKLRPILDGPIRIWGVVYGRRGRLPIGNRERQGNDRAGQRRLQRNLSSLARPHRDTPADAGFTDTPT